MGNSYNKYSNIHSVTAKNPFQTVKETKSENLNTSNIEMIEGFNYTIDHSVSEIENADPKPKKYYFPKPQKQSTAIDLNKLEKLPTAKLRAPLRTISLQKLANSTKKDLKRLSQTKKGISLDQAAKLSSNNQPSDSRLLINNTATIPRN